MKEEFSFTTDKKYESVDFGESSASIASSLTRLEKMQAEMAEAEAKLAQLKAQRDAAAAEIAAAIEKALGPDVGPQVKAIQGRGGRRFSFCRVSKEVTDWKGLVHHLQPPKELVSEYTTPQKYTYYRYTPAKY